jgi:hypothetical protein
MNITDIKCKGSVDMENKINQWGLLYVKIQFVVRTSHRPQYATIRRTRGIKVVGKEHTEHTNTLCG